MSVGVPADSSLGFFWDEDDDQTGLSREVNM